ncbi:reverse transcriptase domain-containing protein, partial [Tanacetum coccineum]
MPVWCRMFQQTLNGPARGWFDRMPNGCINSWANLCEKFVERFALRRRCSKDPTEVLKIVRKANESLPNFKERWTEEMGYIQGVPESEEAFKSTELPKGEQSEKGHGMPYKGFRPSRTTQGGGSWGGAGWICVWGEVLVGWCWMRRCMDDANGDVKNLFEVIEGGVSIQLQVLRQIEGRQVSPGEAPEEKTGKKIGEKKEESPTEDVVINSAFPDQRHRSVGFWARKKQGSDERGGGMAQSGDSEASAIPYIDINSGAGKEDRSEDRGRDGIPIQMFFRRIQMVSPNPNVRRGRGEDGVLHRSRHILLHQNAIRSKKGRGNLPKASGFSLLNAVGKELGGPEEGQYKAKSEKCSFGVKEGKFLGYMVTSEGIRSNPKKTKAVADMQSPKTLREMQSLSGKLATLNRFLSRSAERAMPFFYTLKNITKENKDDFRWTEAAEQAFQELKAVIMELPALTTPNLKETLYVYLAASGKAVSGVVMADRRGKQTPIRYVSRTLHEAEKNYTSLEKLALCLLHLSRRLHRYFEAHPIKVITDQPIKQILNKPDASGKLAKYAVELGAYNIAYMPHNAIKGQVLADFLNEVPMGTGHIE